MVTPQGSSSLPALSLSHVLPSLCSLQLSAVVSGCHSVRLFRRPLLLHSRPPPLPRRPRYPREPRQPGEPRRRRQLGTVGWRSSPGVGGCRPRCCSAAILGGRGGGPRAYPYPGVLARESLGVPRGSISQLRPFPPHFRPM